MRLDKCSRLMALMFTAYDYTIPMAMTHILFIYRKHTTLLLEYL